jgi:hypothetical protein
VGKAQLVAHGEDQLAEAEGIGRMNIALHHLVVHQPVGRLSKQRLERVPLFSPPLRDRSKDPIELQAQIRCQPQENSSRENHLLAIHTDEPAKPKYMRRARMRVKYHKIAAAAPIKFFSC